MLLKNDSSNYSDLKQVDDLHGSCFKDSKNPCCNLYDKFNLHKHLATFFEMMKHSMMIGNNVFGDEKQVI